MVTFESVTAASIALMGATLVMTLIAGPALAYLIWANERGINSLRRWAIWLATIAVLILWAQVVGAAMNTPGIKDSNAFVALGVGIPVFGLGYFLKRRSLLKRNP